jgi:hypothetical protein
MRDSVKQMSVRNRYLMMIKNELPGLFVRHLPHIALYELKIFVFCLLFERKSLSGYAQALRLTGRMRRKRSIIMTRKRVSEQALARWFLT